MKVINNHKMIMLGGLGNQMFQYAYVLSLRDQGHQVQLDTSMYGFTVMHNGYELERVFGIKEDVLFKKGIHLLLLRAINKFRPSCITTFDNYVYNENALNCPKHLIWGYWQDERYFKNVGFQIRKAFSFKNIDTYNQEIAHEMNTTNSVAMHVRRGDYAEFGMSIVGEEYYRKAVNTLFEKVENPVFYIFSDDMEVAEKMAMSMGLNYRLVFHNRGTDSYKDMFLMSQCNHNIIANSSFSWWGAWLNENKDKIVIAPQTWDTHKLNYKPQCNNWILV